MLTIPQVPSKSPYYIMAAPYTRTSAGTRTLHLLAYFLRQLGYEAYICSERTNHYLETPYLSQAIADIHFTYALTPITIYPETIPGNPLSSPLVIRYLGNFSGLLGGPPCFHPSDRMLYYSKNLIPRGETGDVLYIPIVNTSIFYPPPPDQPRTGSCFYGGKYKYYHRGEYQDVTKDSFEITRDVKDSPTHWQIADLFRKSEVFYCYENSSLSLEAMLCGCPVILLPNPYFTKIIAEDELSRNGMAWGDDPAEIERAKKTVHLVWDRYQQTLIEFKTNLIAFADKTQQLAKDTPYRQRVTVVMTPPARYHQWERAIRILINMIKSKDRKTYLREFLSITKEKKLKGMKQYLKSIEFCID